VPESVRKRRSKEGVVVQPAKLLFFQEVDLFALRIHSCNFDIPYQAGYFQVIVDQAPQDGTAFNMVLVAPGYFVFFSPLPLDDFGLSNILTNCYVKDITQNDKSN